MGAALSVTRILDWLANRGDSSQKLKLGELERIALDRNALYDAAVEAHNRCEETNKRLRVALARQEEEARVLRWQLWQAQTGATPSPPPLPRPEDRRAPPNPDDTEDET